MLDIRLVAGRLTRDPEIKEVAEGLKVARFTIACDGDFKDKDGNKKTEFVECEAWRASAEFVGNYVNKGRLVVIVGRMKTDEWEDSKFVDESGAAVLRRKAVITVDKVYPMDKPAGSDDAAYETPESAPQQRQQSRGGQRQQGSTRGAAPQRGGQQSQRQQGNAMPSW